MPKAAQTAGGRATESLSSLVVQDVDSAYLSKVDLQSKADTLLEEVDFLKYLFQSVSQYLKYFYEMISQFS